MTEGRQGAGDWKPTVVVELSHEDDGWFANCKELDYFAGGQTVEQVKHNFTEGLQMSILLHMKLPKPHSCVLCKSRGLLNFDWKFVEGEPA